MGDDSELNAGNIWEWKWGLNSETDGATDPDRGIGVASRPFRDCLWDDQAVTVARLNVFPDAVTVQAYNEVSINIFGNDILPEDYYTNLKLDNNPSDAAAQLHSLGIMKQPVAGTLQVIGTGNNTRIYYQNTSTDNLTNSIDSFVYRAVFNDPSETVPRRVGTTTVYIYVIQSETGFATCTNSINVQLKVLPAGTTFYWYKGGRYISNASTRSITILADSTYMIEPRVPAAFANANLRGVSFPQGEMVLYRNNSANPTTMKWTGNVNTNWYNPQNWVEVRPNGTEAPTTSTPTTCVNVIIPSGLKNYPELTSESYCQNISMEDRAMLKNPHLLIYTAASVELKLKPAERDRFVMWSAPLKNVYTGDYHFENGASYYWGDVYMNLFQAANPDSAATSPASVPTANMFTQTFADLQTPLPLGRAFNIKVTSTSSNREKSFTFPQTYASYLGDNGVTYNTPRAANGNKFIIDGTILDGNGRFDMPVEGSLTNSKLIQVVNPYLAYLDVNQFLGENVSLLEPACKIWTGVVGQDNVTVYVNGAITGQRLIVTDPNIAIDAAYIAPLQSFFVLKRNAATNVTTLKMSPLWTTTSRGEYTLRSTNDELLQTNLLYIKARQGENSSSSVLFYEPKTSPNYMGNEDSQMLFDKDASISVYSFAPSREPLAVNASNDFSSRETKLGLRVKDAGQVTFDFSGMATFGYNVYLIDHALNNKETDIQRTPTYTFTVTKQSVNDKVIELNDRFSLRADYTGIGVGNETISVSGLIVSSSDGYIYVQIPSPASSLQVYNVSGALVYNSNAKSDYFKIPADRQQTYIVKVTLNGEYMTQKVFVK